MSLEIINIGTLPNDGEGDPLRTAFSKINNNFSSLYDTSFSTSSAITTGLTAGQLIYETPAATFTQGMFQIRSTHISSPDSQCITLSAQITNDLIGVKYVGYGGTFTSTSLVTYDMDVLGGYVRILVNPLIDETLTHFISAQVTYVGSSVPGLDIQLDGYVDGFILGTESSDYLTTENQ